MATAAVDWSSLPADLVRLIANKLPAIEDYAAMKASCRSYTSAIDLDQWRSDASSSPPWLLLSCQGGNSAGDNPPSSHRSFLLVGKRKKITIDLPEIHGRRCWASPHGWIVTLGLDRQLHLFNPLNRRRILLPQMDHHPSQLVTDIVWPCDYQKSSWMRKYYIDRAILIKRPPSSYSSSGFADFLVVTMNRYDFHVIRPNSWEPVKVSFLGESCPPTTVCDIAIYNGQIYMLGICGQLYTCSNFDGPDQPTAYACYETTPWFEATAKLYLVESLGELVAVVRIHDGDDDDSEEGEEDKPKTEPHYRTTEFEAYKFNHDTKKWIEMDDLGDCAIFVGNCQSISLSQPEKFGFKRNCIYFTDDYYEQFDVDGDDCDPFGEIGGHDMGIYDFEQGSVEPLYDGADSLSSYSTPTWFFPCLT